MMVAVISIVSAFCHLKYQTIKKSDGFVKDTMCSGLELKHSSNDGSAITWEVMNKRVSVKKVLYSIKDLACR